jgi:hypothetical protein
MVSRTAQLGQQDYYGSDKPSIIEYGRDTFIEG